MNKVVLIGRLCADPEVRVTNSGKSVGNFRIAVNRDYKKGEADFFRVTAWGKTADVIGKYFVKGSQIALVGHLQNSTFEKNGQKITTTDVVLESFDFVGSNNNNANHDSRPKQQQSMGMDIDDDFSLLGDDDDDLPFL